MSFYCSCSRPGEKGDAGIPVNKCTIFIALNWLIKWNDATLGSEWSTRPNSQGWKGLAWIAWQKWPRRYPWISWRKGNESFSKSIKIPLLILVHSFNRVKLVSQVYLVSAVIPDSMHHLDNKATWANQDNLVWLEEMVLLVDPDSMDCQESQVPKETLVCPDNLATQAKKEIAEYQVI